MGSIEQDISLTTLAKEMIIGAPCSTAEQRLREQTARVTDLSRQLGDIATQLGSLTELGGAETPGHHLIVVVGRFMDADTLVQRVGQSSSGGVILECMQATGSIRTMAEQARQMEFQGNTGLTTAIGHIRAAQNALEQEHNHPLLRAADTMNTTQHGVSRATSLMDHFIATRLASGA